MNADRTFRALVGLALLVAGCGVTTPPARFYVLDGATATVSPAQGVLVVGVGPVELPAYLDRPQIVSRASANELEISELHRWAEPLIAHVTSTLAENIQARRHDLRVLPFPWPLGTAVDRQLFLRVVRAEAGPEDEVTIVCAWELRERDSARVLHSGRATVSEAIDGRGAEAEVAALSRALLGVAEGLAGLLPDGVAGSADL